MDSTQRYPLRIYLAVISLGALILAVTLSAQTAGEGGEGESVKEIFSHKLPNVECRPIQVASE